VLTHHASTGDVGDLVGLLDGGKHFFVFDKF
jgi:hypothetical protein